jgi:hypothetical protein
MAYLRPATAQGIFVNFLNGQMTSRKEPLFGIGQVGKSFRNEITSGNFIFRTREQMPERKPTEHEGRAEREPNRDGSYRNLACRAIWHTTGTERFCAQGSLG